MKYNNTRRCLSNSPWGVGQTSAMYHLCKLPIKLSKIIIKIPKCDQTQKETVQRLHLTPGTIYTQSTTKRSSVNEKQPPGVWRNSYSNENKSEIFLLEITKLRHNFVKLDFLKLCISRVHHLLELQILRAASNCRKQHLF